MERLEAKKISGRDQGLPLFFLSFFNKDTYHELR